MISANAAMTGSYDYSEVARSVLIAIAASYAALDLAGRVTAASGRIRLAWLGGGAAAMGIGIWAMHIKGMLAFHLPVPVEYHWPTFLASLLVAILASAVALYVASRQKIAWVQASTGSVIMAGGIAGMHYTGMAAMRLPFSGSAADGIRSARGDPMDCPAKAGQRYGDGSRCLRDALHGHGCRKFHTHLASGPFPRCEHLPPGQQRNRHGDFDRACGRHSDIVRGQAGGCGSPAAQPGVGASRGRAGARA